MAYLVHNICKFKLFRAELDLRSANVRMLLVQVAANTTVDTEADAQTLSGFTTLGEISATGYSRQALAGLTVTQDLTNDRAYFSHSTVAFTSIGGASNDTIGGALVYVQVTNDSDSYPLFYVSFSPTIPTNGGTVNVPCPSGGILLLN